MMELVLKDLVTVIQSNKVFNINYIIGDNLCDTFTFDYASEYFGFAQEVWDFVDEKAEVEIIIYINNKATQL